MSDLFRLPCLAKFHSENWLEDLTVVGRRFPLSVSELDVRDGFAAADEVFLSSDGRSFSTDWHNVRIDGPEAEDSTYVEIRRSDPDARSFHGWVDAVSRKIVQVG